MKRVRERTKPYLRPWRLRSGPAPPTVTLDTSSVPDAGFTVPLPAQQANIVPPVPHLRRAISDSDATPKSKSKKRVRFAQEPEIQYFSCPTPSLSCTPVRSVLPPLVIYDGPSWIGDGNRTPALDLEHDDPLADLIPTQYIRGRTGPSREDDLIYETGPTNELQSEDAPTSASYATSAPIAIPRRDILYKPDPLWLSSTLKEFDASEVLQSGDLESLAPRSFRAGQPFSSRSCNSGHVRSVTY